MKDGVMVINTSRGALIDSQAAIDALKHQKIGALGLDVYENERDLFFEDKSNDVIGTMSSAASPPAITCCLPATGVPHRRGADQHFGDHSG